MNTDIFREYDIRGIAETDLTPDTVTALSKGYGSLMVRRGHKTVVLGHDLRLSSPELDRIYLRGLKSTGLHVIRIGQVTTPALYFAILHYNADGGVMITGSHNPIEYNGFKMCEGMGSVYGDDIREILRIIQQNDFIESDSGSDEIRELMPDYIDMLKSKFSFPKSLKVVIDAGNATAGPVAPQLWRDLGMDVVELYCEPDGRFPNHLPDPTVPKYMVDLQKKVLEENADLGIGYDGDSDRVGAVDNKGRLIFADTLLALFSRDVLKTKPGSQIIFDVKCSRALPVEIEKYGGVPVMWKTGHSLLKAKMQETGAPYAGEMSGHMFFADSFYGFDDGIYASGRLMQILSNTDKTFADLVDEIPDFPSTPEIRVSCADHAKFHVVQSLAKDFKDNKVIDIDGVRVEFKDGWGLVRASNTQPTLVLRFEAETQDRLNAIIDLFKKTLKKYPQVEFDDTDF
ncbi:MAG: phosphomannomutase/phosphoglucomutase [candidate division KSB1 bacterium]|nr:phosphomannomutase/phosphoglucomutase [candidate division KSB1 bacterium]